MGQEVHFSRQKGTPITNEEIAMIEAASGLPAKTTSMRIFSPPFRRAKQQKLNLTLPL